VPPGGIGSNERTRIDTGQGKELCGVCCAAANPAGAAQRASGQNGAETGIEWGTGP